ncbi:MAG: hypothetical protein HQL51_06400, partial [Magnetococcales bacterium]|nr:hypothetical protein [Magnetococcales bacterium]
MIGMRGWQGMAAGSALALAVGLAGCTSYEAKPVAFQSPESMPAHVMIGEQTAVGARAFDDPKQTTEMFGFDILQAGIMPVQVVIDNRQAHGLELRGEQTFLEDEAGNIWPVLDNETAHQRATHYAQTKEIFKEGAYKGMLGAA